MRVPSSMRFTAVVGALLGSATPMVAQTYHLPATPEKGVWMEASYADLKQLDPSFPSTLWFLSGRMPVTGAIRAVADVPFAQARLAFEDGPTESSGVFGNPYLGVEYVSSGFVLETGARLPVNTIDAESFADVVGFLGDYQRGEAFLEDVVPVSGAITYERTLRGGASVRGRAGVVGVFHTDDVAADEEEDQETDALLDYGVLGTYPAGSARFALGFYGRWAATADEGDFGETSVHHLALSADVAVRRVRPGVSVRVPLDSDYNDVLGSTIGLYLQLPLR